MKLQCRYIVLIVVAVLCLLGCQNDYQESDTMSELYESTLYSSSWRFEDGVLTIYDDTAFDQDIQIDQIINSLILSEGVREWKELRFCDLSAVKTVLLPESLERIGPYAARSIYAKIMIPENVNQISGHAFNQSFENISISPNNSKFILLNDFLIEKENGVLIRYLGTAKNVVVPSEVTEIGEDAFFCAEEMETITFPETIIRLQKGAFLFSDSLTAIELPDSVKYIEDQVLCACDQLNTVVVPSGVVFDMKDSNAFVFAGIKRLVFKGDFSYTYFPFQRLYSVEQLVFLNEKPKEIDPYDAFITTEKATIYYLNKYKYSWSPNGETNWGGIPIIGIDSLEDLPIV